MGQTFATSSWSAAVGLVGGLEDMIIDLALNLTAASA